MYLRSPRESVHSNSHSKETPGVDQRQYKVSTMTAQVQGFPNYSNKRTEYLTQFQASAHNQQNQNAEKFALNNIICIMNGSLDSAIDMNQLQTQKIVNRYSIRLLGDAHLVKAPKHTCTYQTSRGTLQHCLWMEIEAQQTMYHTKDALYVIQACIERLFVPL